MKQYTSRKSILAKPMTLGEYNKYRNWDMPKNEDPLKEGYLVEYLDSPTTNMPHGHTNYISWSPKNIFDKSHIEFNPFSVGCIRVGLEFNPTDNTNVTKIKLVGAELIDMVNNLVPNGERSEKARVVNMALTDLEKGITSAVKANFR